MSIDRHGNLIKSLVASAPSPASSGTSLDVTSGDGALFPAPPFNVTVWPAGSDPILTNAEILRVTAISTDTFTIARTQEGTSARTIVGGDNIRVTITNKTLQDVELPPLVFTHNFASDSRLDGATYGSGNQTTNVNGGVLECASGSAAAARQGMTIPDYPFDGNPRFSATIRPYLLDTANAGQMYVGIGNITVNHTAGHTFTEWHLGFKLVNESGTWKLRATQGNGTTETQSAVLDSAPSAYDFYFLKLIKYGTSGVDYYWAKNNGAYTSVTLTTNIPTANNRAELQASVSSVNTVDQVAMYPIQMTYYRG